jgi:4-alpha-glucanotransferase
MTHNLLSQRRVGVLLHPTSLPSGKLDSDAERWLQFLGDTGFSVWQVLPLGEPQGDMSPYQCSSAFAFNPALFDDCPDIDKDDSAFLGFCDSQSYWLDDYAHFKVLKHQFKGAAWSEWPLALRKRDKQALHESSRHHIDAIDEIRWHQYCYHCRWQEIRSKANRMNILLFGDMPIFVAYDSADVWAHQDMFMLDEQGQMTVVSGVPPDYFSETGQRWGNPHYDWDNMKQDGYHWWRSRVHHHLELFDLIRIDHFRGFEAVWVIDAECDTAIDGYWQEVPGDDLLTSLKLSLAECHGELPFIAEDLGIITPEVTALRLKHELPGMSVLQFGFDNFDDNPHKLKNIDHNRVVYTGTHDNDTTKGWYNSLPEYDKNLILKTLDLSADKESISVDDVVDKMIENAMYSLANLSIIPMQDYLHLGSQSRMNTPGTIEGNWSWRFQWQQLDDDRQQKFLAQVIDSGRKRAIPEHD